MKRRSFFIPANACWLNSLANQEVYILNHQNIIYEHTMKLKCEMCPQDATFVVGCGNKTACSRCVTTRKCNPSRERAIEITQQDAKEMPCDICKSNPVSVVCLEDRAFLCTDCDLKIHSANDFAGHHQRFAFTNAKMALPEGVSKEKPEVPEHVPIAIRTNKVRCATFDLACCPPGRSEIHGVKRERDYFLFRTRISAARRLKRFPKTHVFIFVAGNDPTSDGWSTQKKQRRTRSQKLFVLFFLRIFFSPFLSILSLFLFLSSRPLTD